MNRCYTAYVYRKENGKYINLIDITRNSYVEAEKAAKKSIAENGWTNTEIDVEETTDKFIIQ